MKCNVARLSLALLGFVLVRAPAFSQAPARVREATASAAASPAADAPADVSGKAPVPDAARVEQIRKDLIDAYPGSNGFGDTSPDGKKRLAQKLISDSGEPEFSADDRYTMLDMSLQLATSAWDVETVFGAVDAINESYQGDAAARTLGAYTKLATSAADHGPPGACVVIAARGLDVIENRFAQDDLDGLLPLLDAVSKVTAAANDDELRSRLEPLSIALHEYSHAVAALELLVSNPGNAQANSDAGVYYFVKGDFEKARPYLALGLDKGVNGELRELAIKDRDCPADLAMQEQLGIAWSTFGEKAPARLKRPALLRSLDWDDIVIPQVTGFALKKVRNHADGVNQLLAASSDTSVPGALASDKQPAAADKRAPLAGSRRRLPWAETLEAEPDPKVVTDPDLLKRLRATGLPWRVRAKASGIEMVCVPHGTFRMGATADDGQAQEAERPDHEVTISQDFYIGRFETSVSEWNHLMTGEALAKGRGPPQANVSYDEVQEFLTLSFGLQLATEAQWEYAARAGEGGTGPDDLDACTWNKSNAEGHLHDVGGRKPNALGVYDMLGNVWEWCQDWHDGMAYKKAKDGCTDPVGPDNAGGNYKGRVLRGGGFYNDSRWMRFAGRTWRAPGYTADDVGFRVARFP